MFIVKYTTLYSVLSECMLVCVCAVYDFLYLYVNVCVLHTSECVSKVPHSFIMSSKYEEQKSRDKQKRSGKVG